MRHIIVCIIGIIGFVVCEIIENIMWEHDREKALDMDYYSIAERRNDEL